MEWRISRVTTHAKPHTQQQLARDLEVDYENVLTNVRGPPEKYGLLTPGRPCVRCYSTLRAWYPVCGSTLRVSQDNMTTEGDIYVPGTYTKLSFHFLFDEIYRRLLFFTLGRSVSA